MLQGHACIFFSGLVVQFYQHTEMVGQAADLRGAEGCGGERVDSAEVPVSACC